MALLDEPIIITFRWRQKALMYPLFYKQTVNNQPKELITGYGWTADNLACPPTLDKNGLPIPFSEGFLCSGFFSDSTRPMRNGVNFNLFGQVYTRSCLVFDSIWYDVFSIGPGEELSQVFFDVSFFNVTTGVRQNSTFDLSPSNPIGVSADGSVKGEFIGTFSNFRQYPELSQMLFFFPSKPVGSDVAGSMLLPLSLVDLSGRTPDKVGVSFEGFNNQGSACTSTAGSGLKGQLDSYYKEDMMRVRSGLAPNYLLNGAFDFFAFVNGTSGTQQKYVLTRPISSPPQSLVH